MPPQVQHAPRRFGHELVGDSRRDEQLPTGCVLLHPRRDVDRITKSGEVHDRASNVADVGDARIDGHAQLEPGLVVPAVADCCEQVHPGLNGAASVLGTADASDKESHDLIANEFVDYRVMPQKGLCRSTVEPVEQ